jgi:hypothetical protein
MENELAGVLPKTTSIYRRKPYPEPISKADTKPVTVNIAAISVEARAQIRLSGKKL